MFDLFLLLMCRIANGLRTDTNFAVTACNNADNVPEMTLRIKSNYFVDNLSWQTGFMLTDDETAYERKIPEDQLLVDLSEQCKFLFFRKMVVSCSIRVSNQMVNISGHP